MAEVYHIPTNLKFHNLTGRTFGEWSVLSFAGKKMKRSVWNCQCSCGRKAVVFAQTLKDGRSTSCGHVRNKKTAIRNTTHGKSSTREYRIWKAIHTRCTNTRQETWEDYGGRGITVCDRWLGPNGFLNFLADMGCAPSDSHSIDRIDNDGNYEPGNCRWATPKEQTRNARSNINLEFNGQTRSIGEWSEIVGFPYHTLRSRILRGWTAQKALTTPIRKY